MNCLDLKSGGSEQESGHILARFETAGDKPLLVEASFTHYLASIDLIEGKMQLKFMF